MATVLRRTGSGAYYGKMTISLWVKRAKLGEQGIFGRREGSATANLSTCHFTSDDQLLINFRDGGGNSKYYMITNRKFRDVNAWYHIVFAIDGTDGTEGDRSKLYINGVRETSFALLNNPSSTGYEVNMFLGGSYHTYIARGLKSSSDSWLTFEGCMSHINCSTGYTYDASVFGSTDSVTGEWQINTSPSFTLGTDGFTILKDGNTITDQSSNSNDFSLYSGTLTKTEDCPSNIFATWNPQWSASNGNVGDVTFSNGNTTTSTSSSYRTTPTTLGMKSGKYYWEIKRLSTTSGDTHFGVMSENATPANTATWIGNAANGWVIAGDNGQTYTGGTSGGILSNGSVGNGAIFMGAYDGATGKLYFGRDGVWAGTANPSTGANAHYTLDTSLIYFPCVSTGSDVSANFGNGFFGTTQITSEGNNASAIGKFEFHVPTGFTALSTKGLNL